VKRLEEDGLLRPAVLPVGTAREERRSKVGELEEEECIWNYAKKNVEA
jgi:hypothetical protein